MDRNITVKSKNGTRRAQKTYNITAKIIFMNADADDVIHESEMIPMEIKLSKEAKVATRLSGSRVDLSMTVRNQIDNVIKGLIRQVFSGNASKRAMFPVDNLNYSVTYSEYRKTGHLTIIVTPSVYKTKPISPKVARYIPHGSRSPISLAKIRTGNLMANMHDEFTFKRFYKKENLNQLVKSAHNQRKNAINPFTRQTLTPGNITYYTAIVSSNNDNNNNSDDNNNNNDNNGNNSNNNANNNGNNNNSNNNSNNNNTLRRAHEHKTAKKVRNTMRRKLRSMKHRNND